MIASCHNDEQVDVCVGMLHAFIFLIPAVAPHVVWPGLQVGPTQKCFLSYHSAQYL